VPTRNAFDLLDTNNTWEFPSLEVAATTRQSRHTRWQPSQQQNAVPEASIPSLVVATSRPPRKVFPPNQLVFKETKCHVLDAPVGYAKAHSVDQTFHMSAGIAVDFKNEIGQTQKLLSQNKKVGQVAYVKDTKGDYVLYMIAKRKHFYKPTPDYINIFKSNYIKALYGLRKTCIQLKIKKLAIPRMGCHTDQLSWENFMKPSILEIFDTVPMEILLCESTPRTPRAPTNTPSKIKENNQLPPLTIPTTPPPLSPPRPNPAQKTVIDDTNQQPVQPLTPIVTVIHTENNVSPLHELSNLIDHIGSLTAARNSVQPDINNSTPTYTNLTNMTFYTPQDTDSSNNTRELDKTIELSDAELGYTISQKNLITPIPFPTL